VVKSASSRSSRAPNGWGGHALTIAPTRRSITRWWRHHATYPPRHDMRATGAGDRALCTRGPMGTSSPLHSRSIRWNFRSKCYPTAPSERGSPLHSSGSREDISGRRGIGLGTRELPAPRSMRDGYGARRLGYGQGVGKQCRGRLRCARVSANGHAAKSHAANVGLSEPAHTHNGKRSRPTHRGLPLDNIRISVRDSTLPVSSRRRIVARGWCAMPSEGRKGGEVTQEMLSWPKASELKPLGRPPLGRSLAHG